MNETKMETLFNSWEKIIRAHEKTPGIEIEIRFGKVNRGSFDTNVTKDTYDRVLRRLKKYDGWECIEDSDTSRFYYDGGRRATYDNVKDDIVECVLKKRVLVNDVLLKDEPFDVRLGISTEQHVEHKEDEEYVKVRNVKRSSFIRKNLRIDISAITGDPDDKDSEHEVEYQIELELMSVPEKQHELYNMVYKVFDVLKIIP
jgi:hypothetical protein